MKQFKPRTQDEKLDLIQCGSIGLLRAIRKHKPHMGKLTTIAWDAIRWEIIRYLKKERKHWQCESLDEDYSYLPAASSSDIIPDNLSSEEREAFFLRKAGYSFLSIGKQIGKGRTATTNIFNNAVSKIRHANR